MKKMFLCLVLVILLVTGCGSALSKYSGTYIMEYSKFVGDADTDKKTGNYEKIVLNDDGTGQSIRDGLNIVVEWHMDGENITLIERYAGATIEYSGTIKDNRLDLFDGDKENALTNEKVYNKD